MPVRLLRDELRELYSAYIEELKPAVVVDVGTGLGESLRALVEASGSKASVLTIDMDCSTLQRARAVTHHAYERGAVDLMCADAHKLPLRGESVKLLATVAMLHHLADAEAFVEGCARVLARGGVAVIVDWTPGSRLSPHPPSEHREALAKLKRLLPEYLKLEDLRVYKDYFIAVGAKP